MESTVFMKAVPVRLGVGRAERKWPDVSGHFALQAGCRIRAPYLNPNPGPPPTHPPAPSTHHPTAKDVSCLVQGQVCKSTEITYP